MDECPVDAAFADLEAALADEQALADRLAEALDEHVEPIMAGCNPMTNGLIAHCRECGAWVRDVRSCIYCGRDICDECCLCEHYDNNINAIAYFCCSLDCAEAYDVEDHILTEGTALGR